MNTPFRSRTLIVDDDGVFVELLRMQLAQDVAVEHEIDVARSLGEAMAAIAAVDHDVLLLDLGLPDSQGRSTLSAVVAAAGDTPVIVLTSTADWGFRNPAIRLGAEDYVLKVGLEADVLNRSIRHAVERRALRRDLDEARERERRERELQDLRRLASATPSPGSDPSFETDPSLMERLRKEYADVLGRAVDAETHRTGEDVRARLRVLAHVLAGHGAGPQEVMRLHTETLQAELVHVPRGEAQAWLAEARVAVVALLGDLVAAYRDQAGRQSGG